MKIQFVNHASFIIEYQEIRLICDPWMEGTAFDQGWKQLSKTRFGFDEFSSVTHIWFSHEHPDHFAPPNLNKIPKEYREKIKVLYQDTIDHKVVEFCRKIGFKELIEMPSDTWVSISDDFRIMCNPYTDGDSYALFEIGGVKILNLNDCPVKSKEQADDLYKKTGEIDVLFTQFGYANKVGNTEEVSVRQRASDEKLQRISLQSNSLKPKVIIPFASFVFFCHEENKYMNEGVNKIDVVFDYIQNKLNKECVVLYPGDSWTYGEHWDSVASVEKYMKDYEALASFEYLKAVSVPESEIISNANAFLEKLLKGFPSRRNTIKSMNARFFLTDLNKVFEFSGKNGLVPAEGNYASCNISISSGALNYCFKELWGFGTLNINARFQVINDYYKVRRIGNIAGSLNRQEPFPEPNLTSRIISRIKRMLGA